MTVEDVINLKIINDDTTIHIQKWTGYTLKGLAHGKHFQDRVLRYSDSDISSFRWSDDNTVLINIKRE